MFLERGISKWQVYIWSPCVLPFAVEVFVLLHLGAQITPCDLSVTATVTRTTQIANDKHARSETIMKTATMPEKYKEWKIPALALTTDRSVWEPK